jgi:peptidylprolyl isomerase
MIQGGDPTGTGTGGESIWKKEFINEYAPNVVFDKPFILAMANHGPNTNGSQFFITTVPTPHLNGGYTIFGEVVAGSDIVQKIEDTKTARADRPVVEQKIIKAYIK